MKRFISILAVLAVTAAITIAPLGAVAAPKPSVEDPANDANFINDQGTGDGSFGDHVGPADASEIADLLSVTFTNDKKNLYVHIETESTALPIAGEGFRVRTNPDGPGGVYCLYFEIFFPGAQNTVTDWVAHLRDACAANETIEATGTLSPLGGFLIEVPRKAHDGLGKGSKLTAPQAGSFLYSGTYPAGVVRPFLDTTKPGTDYALKK